MTYFNMAKNHKYSTWLIESCAWRLRSSKGGMTVSKSWNTSGNVMALTAASRFSSGKSTIPGLSKNVETINSKGKFDSITQEK